MTLTKRDRLKSAGLSFFVLLTLATSASAQAPRKKENLTRAEREEWYQILRWPAELENDWRKSAEGSTYGGLSFYKLGRGKYLVEVNAYPVAYQSGYIYMIYDEANRPKGPGRLLLLKGFETVDESGRPLSYSKVSAIVSKFHAKTKALEVFSKYRAAGDCGLYVRYKFINRRPVVVEAREQDCDVSGRRTVQLDPHRWPRKKL
jgi:hypothetical protein